MRRALCVLICLVIAVPAMANLAHYYAAKRREALTPTAADLHWVDPYSTNLVGTAFLLDWPTNTVLARGSIGSGWDSGATNGIATQGVVSNLPSVAAGPMWSDAGTNSLGDVNYAWLFDKANDSMRINDSDLHSLGDGLSDINWTIYGWVCKTGAVGTEAIMSRSESTKREYYISTLSSYRLRVIRYGNAASDTTNFVTCTSPNNVFVTNKWVFMTLTWDGTQLTPWTNAIPFAWATQTTNGNYVAMTNTTARMEIGSLGASAYFGGYFAFMGIVRTNITGTEVTNLYTGLGGNGGPGQSIRKRQPAGAYPP